MGYRYRTFLGCVLIALSVLMISVAAAPATARTCRWHLRITGGQRPNSPVVLHLGNSCDRPGGAVITRRIGSLTVRPRRQIWVWAEYWNCRINLVTGQLSACRFIFNRYVWVPRGTVCGMRNIGPYHPVTVCWLHHRRIIGPAPLPPFASLGLGAAGHVADADVVVFAAH